MFFPACLQGCALTLRRLAGIAALLLLLLPAQPAFAQDDGIHIVVAGDTLSEIAAAYGTDVETLRELNDITGNLIRIGQRLIVGKGARAGAPAGPVASTPVRTQSYVVQRGDNLSRIAQRFGVTVDEILRANEIANPRLIAPGQTIQVPSSGLPSMPDAEQEATPQRPFPADPGKWIDVDLSAQRVVAYEGSQVIRTFRVSTGLPGTPTVTGSFRIRLKMPVQDMRGGNRASGDAYYLEDVPWVQYFFQDYAFHGTYWHTNFGYPASRGCINMDSEDAEWLFYWTGPTYDPDGYFWQGATAGNPGTLIVVHE